MNHYELPTSELLDSDRINLSVSAEEEEQKKKKVLKVLDAFAIQVNEVKSKVGPGTITYELGLPHGIDLQQARKYRRDIIWSIAERGVRLQIPIPGKVALGVKILRDERERLPFRKAVESSAFRETEAVLPIAIGMTNDNEMWVKDLAKCPHLLIAGEQSTGKHMLLKSIVLSLLYKKGPDELKFVFMTGADRYAEANRQIQECYWSKLPEVSEPIMPDDKTGMRTIYSLCEEMYRRSDLLRNSRSRQIVEHNQKVREKKLGNNYEVLPYIVVIIDELEDWMFRYPKFELSLSLLGTLSRAVGIHLVAATKRAGHDVISGMLKALFDARIAFSVPQEMNSRLVLDHPGAENLASYGDMLYCKSGKLERIQGFYIDEKELEKVASHIYRQGVPSPYLLPEPAIIEEEKAEEDDELFDY
ncbi:DNA translocase FtsK [Bacteroides caecicola]|uniref:DNA translocase FtsK n=1 Tax=Bacteroides caecicola TaxID=1462569 RepID=A0ABS2F4N4_9BACE|nr:DNA translocase FtsK [Bacteroides caecicola]MBM6805014.1 DNA translocase FtsK [Bacteroides caecicola]